MQNERNGTCLFCVSCLLTEMQSPSQVCSQSQCYAVALIGGEGEGAVGQTENRM